MGNLQPSLHRHEPRRRRERDNVERDDSVRREIDELIEENVRLKELVIQLSRIAIRNSIGQK